MSKKVRAKPRQERTWPQVERCLSINFLTGFKQVQDKCFVPLSDFRRLEKKYHSLLKRYFRRKKVLTKVYLLEGYDCDGSSVIKAFSSKEDADELCDRCVKYESSRPTSPRHPYNDADWVRYFDATDIWRDAHPSQYDLIYDNYRVIEVEVE